MRSVETNSPKALRLAIGQLRMRWTIEENCNAIERSMRVARQHDADICSFPELAVTGFHRRIVELATPQQVGPAIERIQTLCEQLRMAVAVGAPSFNATGQALNSYLLIDERGALTVVSKKGLTDAEATFFARGAVRPIATLQRQRCSAVMCREIEDEAEVVADLASAPPSLLFWPGIMSPDSDVPERDPPLHIAQAQSLARTLGCTIIQANWPNDLNRPEEGRELGHSVVISPEGVVMFRLPKDRAGTAIFAAGASSYHWMPEEAPLQ